jgi:cytochrome c-type biogenesis protein CcmE
MSSKFVFAILVVAVSLGALIFSAIGNTAKAVVTVHELVEDGSDRGPVQLGARVSENSEIQTTSSPERLVSFKVNDIGQSGKSIEVRYAGNMPDTLKPGRDVILQGHYKSGTFHATELLTQCPSKYEPPIPGGTYKDPLKG